ncbi:MAG: HlyD family efflux transporter periplasmic adaptor subunit [Planctomycetes bacterium]|nr:HlyD family efflux transporter periplasmic adaptor subunit [Planctomycetota bacterium]
MHGSPSMPRATARGRRLGGAAPGGWIMAVPVLLLLLLAIAWRLLPKYSWSSEDTGPMMHQVERGEFVHEITARGNVESANNVEIKCEIPNHWDGRQWAGTMILWVIPEGTDVEPAPDWEPDPDNPDEDAPDLLVKLDASLLETQKGEQQISCNKKKAEVILAKKNLESARSWLREYVEGVYQREKQRIGNWNVTARKEYGRAQEYLDDGKALLAQGFIVEREVQKDRFAAARARKEWEAAYTGLRVLEDYTKPKFVKDRLSDIAISIAAVEAVEQVHQMAMDKLALIEEQIEKCTIRAPAAGQVVYANEQKHREKQIVIEAGIVVHEHQILIRLPDPTTMQIKAKIKEAAIATIQEGMPASIRLDAHKDLELAGTVQKVNEYPEPSSWHGTSDKEYETTIGISGLPTDEAGERVDLRPGMTAEVKIRVKTLPDVIRVPVEAVLEHRGKHYCVQQDGEKFRLRRVTLGASNDETVVILKGLEAAEQIVMETVSYRDEPDSPHFRAETSGRPLLHRVQRGEFVHEITERGSVESAENVEIKCEVEGYSTMILWVIPEGTYVEPAPDWEPAPDNPDEDPPDLLVKLDASSWKDQKRQQQTWNSTSEAVVIRANNELEKAQITLREYVNGKYEQEQQTIETRILVAGQEHTRAQHYLEDSELLLAKGFVSEREVQQDRFAVTRARTDLELARMALRVLDDYKKPKTEMSLRAEIKTAVSKLDSEQKKHELNLRRLARIEEHIANCKIRAPAAGQVVYAHEKNWWGQPIIIDEGARVREGQTLVQLPNFNKMQVKAKINEGSVTMIREGMPAKIHLDAYQGVELTGSIQMVNEYADASSGLGAAVKEYEATIDIDALPTDEAGERLGLRPGMTAEVRVCVETLRDAIQVPVEAVLEHARKHYCVQPDGESFRLRSVTLGPTGNETVVIVEGLKVGEQVVRETASYRDRLDLPHPTRAAKPRPRATSASRTTPPKHQDPAASPGNTALDSTGPIGWERARSVGHRQT